MKSELLFHCIEAWPVTPKISKYISNFYTLPLHYVTGRLVYGIINLCLVYGLYKPVSSVRSL